METLFELSVVDDISNLLPCMKRRLMSGTGNSQVGVVEQILMSLRKATKPQREIIVEKLIRFDVISTLCGIMQTSDESFIKIVLECFELISAHIKFYENHAAMDAIESMLRLSYCVNKSLKDSTLFERLVKGICCVLVGSSELAVNLDNVCDLQQIILFLKNLDFQDSQKDQLKFVAVTILNVILQRATLDDISEEKIIVDLCRDALKSMTEFVKYGDDDEGGLLAAFILCGTCAGSSRFCNVDLELEDQTESNVKLRIYQEKADLAIHIYDTVMNIIIPYIKDTDLSRVDSIGFHRDFVSCLNNLYQLRNCNHDNLSNHLAANGYLKYFLHLTVLLPKTLRSRICILLTRILSILGKTAFSQDTIKFADVLRQGLLELPKDSIERWNDVIAKDKTSGTALMILLYYHFHGTQDNDMISMQSLIARVLLLPKSNSIPVFVLKPLWFLFAVKSISHSRSNSIPRYKDAVTRLTCVLQHLEISEFYTHHIDLMHYCLKSPDVSQDLKNQVLDLWLIESDGDIKPLLPFNCDKVIHRLLMVVQTGYPQRIISLAVKGLRQLIQIGKGDQYVDQIADIVWHMLPNILSSYKSNTVAHIEATLELANITQPQTIATHLITRIAASIVNIVLKKNTDLKFMIVVIKQAYVLLVSAVSRNSFKVFETYVQKRSLLRKLYNYGFSKETSELSTISLKLLALLINFQKKSSIKCKRSLVVHIRSLVEMLTCARKSPCCAMNAIQFICELLTQQNVDGSIVVLRKISYNYKPDMEMVINLYEILHIIHVQKDLTQRDMIYQCLTALLNFCNAEVNKIMSHLCTVMSNYDFIFNVVNMRYVSCDLIEFIITWLRYRKENCNDVPWNARSLFKSPFDEALDHLREYSVFVNNKGLKDAYLNLQRALSQFE